MKYEVIDSLDYDKKYLSLSWEQQVSETKEYLDLEMLKALDSAGSRHLITILSVSYDKYFPVIQYAMENNEIRSCTLFEEHICYFQPLFQIGELSSLVGKTLTIDFTFNNSDSKSFFDYLSDDDNDEFTINEIRLLHDDNIERLVPVDVSDISYGNTADDPTAKMESSEQYIGTQLYEIAEELYEEMYGSWKIDLLRKKGIPAPTNSEFHQQAAALLPQSYMKGVKGAQSNVLYNAIERMETNKAKMYIRRTQYLSIEELSQKYQFDHRIVQKEWDYLWTLVYGEPCNRMIPQVLASKFIDWFQNDSLYSTSGTNNFAPDNQWLADGLKTAIEIVKLCLLINSISPDEYQHQGKLLKRNANTSLLFAVDMFFYESDM